MFEWVLWIISFFVYLRLVFKQDAWALIVVYWGVLCLKNLWSLGGAV